MSSIEEYVAPIQGDPEKRFEVVKFIGKGSFGFVELCKDTQNNNKLVCRKIARNIETTLSEILTLYRSKHKNIIRFYGYYKTQISQTMIDRSKDDGETLKLAIGTEVVCLIIEFGECGDFEKYIRERKSIEQIILVKIITQIVQALQFLNLNNNIHRDIKPENILISKYGDAKLADFGTVFQLEKKDTHKNFTSVQGTTIYVAPEFYMPHKYKRKYDFLVDIFSLGVVIYKACNSEIDEAYLGDLINTKKPKFLPKQYTDTFNDLVLSMISIDVSERANTSQILEKINQIITPVELDENQQKIYDQALNLFYGYDGIFDRVEALNKFKMLVKKTKLQCPGPAYHLAQCYFYGYETEKDIKLAISLLQAASMKHHAESLKFLSFCYQHGIGVEKDLFTAIQLLTLIQKKDLEASFLLGYEYYNSTTTDIDIKNIGKQSKVSVYRDFSIAFHFLSQAKTFPPAQNYLGLCYLNGNGTKKDLFEAYKYFNLSAEGGYLDGMYNLADFYLTHKSDDQFYKEKALNLLTEAANQYHMGAIFKLYELYSKGDIIEKDEKKAQYYSKMNSKGPNTYDSNYSYALFKLKGNKDSMKNENEAFTRFTTISENHPGAVYRIGQWYLNSLMINEIIYTLNDEEEEAEAQEKRESKRRETEKMAADCFEQASNKGILDATGNFALCLLTGKGRECNQEKAISMLEEASELGSLYSSYLLAQCYLKGLGVTQDKEHALELLRKSHLGGLVEATYLLAHCLHNGEGIKPEEFGFQTLHESRKLYDIAVKKGHAKAAYELGMIFNINGEIFANKYKAANMFEIAANQNHPAAMTELGILYENGSGVICDYQKANKLYQKAINVGDKKAIYRMGMCYLKGYGVEQNVKKARDLFEQSSEDDIIDAKVELGIMYLNGICGEKNEKKAVKLFEQAANNNNIDGKVQLGKCLLKGIGIEKNKNKAIQYFSESIKEDHIEGSYHLALLYLENNEEEAIKIFDHLIDSKKHIPSMYELGKHYVEKFKDENELANGIILLEKAASENNGDALDLLGICYLLGLGVDINNIKAFRCFEDAISAGNLHSKVNLGQCYIEGNGVPMNPETGFRILTEAPKDDPAAKFRIGVCYYKGVGVDQDIKKGIELIKEAVLENDYNAMCYYGKLLLNGKDVEMDKVEAIKLFGKAANKGHAEAKFQLGRIYEYGMEHIFQNKDQALDLYKQSSDLKCDKALYRLGQHYFYDCDEKKKGIDLFIKAADLCNTEAFGELARIYNEGDGVPADPDKAMTYSQRYEDPQLSVIKMSMMQSMFNSNEKKMKQQRKPILKPPIKKRKATDNGYYSSFPFL